MMEDSSMLVEIVLKEFSLEGNLLNPNSDFQLDIFTHKTPDSEVQLIETTFVETFQRNENW